MAAPAGIEPATLKVDVVLEAFVMLFARDDKMW